MTGADTTAAGVLEGWETVIGLEVHAELATRTKLFSGALNQFGSDPNTNIDPVSLGLPGSLPVLNEKAVELAIRVGLALNCEIRPSLFARKNYFYPDMPKDFQISQYDQPIDVGGWLELPSGKRVGITRAHLEEDTGKNTHMGGTGRIGGAEYSLIDYNRSGVPLLEIVSEPDLRSAEEARDYVEELRAILVAIGASDGKMEEGSLRVDCNVSVRRPGEPFGTRCEIKNVNSLRSLGRAVLYEASRQVDLLTAGEPIRQETRHWDEDNGRTTAGRSKENSDDYRYFPEPDLVPVAPGAEWIEQIRAALPALPAQRRQRLAVAAGLARGEQSVVVAVNRGLDELALEAIGALGPGSPAASRARVLTHIEHNLAGEGADALPAASLAALVALEGVGKLTATQAKVVLADMVAHLAASGPLDPLDPAAFAAKRGFEAMEAASLDGVLDEVLGANVEQWARYVAGDAKERGRLTGFFVGLVMKATEGKANGKAVTAALQARAEAGA